jgi:hypothetical protein
VTQEFENAARQQHAFQAEMSRIQQELELVAEQQQGAGGQGGLAQLEASFHLQASKITALHAFTRLVSRPDSLAVFKEFDTDDR